MPSQALTTPSVPAEKELGILSALLHHVSSRIEEIGNSLGNSDARESALTEAHVGRLTLFADDVDFVATHLAADAERIRKSSVAAFQDANVDFPPPAHAEESEAVLAYVRAWCDERSQFARQIEQRDA